MFSKFLARKVSLAIAASCTAALLMWSGDGHAFGETTAVQIRVLDLGASGPLPEATRRLAWEVRQRTSVETELGVRTVQLSDPALFEGPLLYLRGEHGFDPRPEADVVALRRFLQFGGFLIIDDASSSPDFEQSALRLLGRVLPRHPVAPVPAEHVVYRSFYLVSRPQGRRRGPEAIQGIEIEGRMAVLFSRHDLGGAWARDNLGHWLFAVEGGDSARENAVRLGVNLVMYALCLDYKDDQVHAPELMRRRAGAP